MLKNNTSTISSLLSTSLLLLTFSTTIIAKSPVWEVKKGDNTLYIGGTIHLLSKQDYPLPDAFEQAYQNSDTIIFETDISEASALATQAKMLPAIMSQDGTSIESKLDKNTFTRLERFLQERQLPMQMFQMLTPAGINLTLLALELQKMGVNSESGVETHFDKRANKDDKPINWLETIDEQVAVLNAMNLIEPNMMINTTLDDLMRLKEEWPKLLSVWRNGDMQALETLGIDTMIETSPELYQALVVKRNTAWAPKIRQMLETKEIEFVLVGALHLAGQHSVLELINESDLEIRQLD